MAYSTKTLAEGCFGKVYKEKYGGTWAAVKRVPLGRISKQQLDRECRVYHNARHPNVVKLLGEPWLEDSKWNIPLEFITGEDLEMTIFNTQNSKIQLTSSVRATIITGMCEGLLHLHSRYIVHQDLKPDNIMIEHNTHRAVIIDLGLAKFFKNGITSAINLGNEAYSAPEILNGQGVRDGRSDVWAMGKVIAELCARVRLPTNYVSPIKIQECLGGHPYCNAICRMVEANTSARATMAGVIAEIRRAEAVLRAQVRAEAEKGAVVGVRAGAGVGVGVRAGAGVVLRAGAGVKAEAEVGVGVGGSGSNTREQHRGRQQTLFPRAPEVKRISPPVTIIHHSPSPRATQVKTLSPPVTVIHRSPSPRATHVKTSSPPVTVFHRSPSPRAAEVKALVSLLNPQANENMGAQLLQKMPHFPCPLPTTGIVRHSRYVEEDGRPGTLEVREVVMRSGRVVKYEDLMVTADQ